MNHFLGDSVTTIGKSKFLVLGCGEGWHAGQLKAAADRAKSEISFADYESLSAQIGELGSRQYRCSAGPLRQFDAILARTMPAGSLEQITFRLAILHACYEQGQCILNPPRSLEIAIDKFATLDRVAALGYPVPETMVSQSRIGAMNAFDSLGGDCIVKPIFGGEGRGVMRIKDRQLAWYTFATLERLSAVFYVQKFVAPGGADTRLLVVGDEVFAVRRQSDSDFRTNVSTGANVHRIDVSEQQRAMALDICSNIGLHFASVDVLDSDDGQGRVLEVNAIPGWKGAQGVLNACIADQIVATLARLSNTAGHGVSK